MAPDFAIEVQEPVDGKATVVVAGEIDMAVCDELLEAVAKALHRGGGFLVEIDMAGVEFLDAYGVGALLSIRDAAYRQGKVIRVVDVRGMPARVLQICGVLPALVPKVGTASVI